MANFIRSFVEICLIKSGGCIFSSFAIEKEVECHPAFFALDPYHDFSIFVFDVP